jgi:hypothetical protein
MKRALRLPQPQQIVVGPSDSMLVAFWGGAGALCLVLLYAFATQPSWRAIGGAAIVFASLVPVYLWCANRIGGVPIFPIFSLTFTGTYAYPLLSNHPIVLQYSDDAGLVAGLVVMLFLLLATACWYAVMRGARPRAGVVRAMSPGHGDYLFLALICGAALLTLGVTGGWFESRAGVFSIVRAALFGLSSVGIFVLSYRWGKRELELGRIPLFLGAMTLYIVSQLMTLVMVSALVATLLASAAFVFGRRELPWKTITVALCFFSVFHAGKSDMRERYWYPEPVAIQIWHFPALAAEWAMTGLQSMVTPDVDEETQPLYERLSLVHLLLKVQDESPGRVPYLHGETYGVIPYLLVPRILNPDKLAAHEGTTLLSMHYGLQTREDTERTTIGWGLLNEAVANFGFPGVLLLAIILGALYGWVTRMAVGMPVLSLPTLVAITFMAFAAQTEFTAGVYVSALFQSLVSLLAMSFVFMDRQFLTHGPG